MEPINILDKLEEFVQNQIDSIDLPVVPLSFIINHIEELGYTKTSEETNGWQVDFWIYFQKGLDEASTIVLSGSLYYGDYKLTKENNE